MNNYDPWKMDYYGNWRIGLKFAGVVIALLSIVYADDSMRNYRASLDCVKNEARIEKVRGKEEEKNRDFPINPECFDSLRTVHQRATYVTKSITGAAVIVTAYTHGRYEYKKINDLDGIIDAEGVGNYIPMTGDTLIVSEHSVNWVIKFPRP